jgi:hypothetical protein
MLRPTSKGLEEASALDTASACRFGLASASGPRPWTYHFLLILYVQMSDPPILLNGVLPMIQTKYRNDVLIMIHNPYGCPAHSVSETSRFAVFTVCRVDTVYFPRSIQSESHSRLWNQIDRRAFISSDDRVTHRRVHTCPHRVFSAKYTIGVPQPAGIKLIGVHSFLVTSWAPAFLSGTVPCNPTYLPT